MMSLEDLVIESIQAASAFGDSPDLRIRQCDKIQKILEAMDRRSNE